MNNDELFRQALQRQNDRAARMKMPYDMEQRVMDRIKPKSNTRLWVRSLSVVAVAASILLLLTWHDTDKNVEPKEKSLTAQQTEPMDNMKNVREEPAIGQRQLSYAGSEQTRLKADEQPPVNTSKTPVVARDIQARHDSAIKSQPTINTKSASAASTADQLNDYIARLEAEMEAVDDSVRSAHLEKLIAADARLQQLVNRIVKDETEQAMRELLKDSTANYINF